MSRLARAWAKDEPFGTSWDLRTLGNTIRLELVRNVPTPKVTEEDAMEDRQPLDVVETAGLENAAELALTAFCWWRADVRNEGVVGDLMAGAAADELAKKIRAVHTYPV